MLIFNVLLAYGPGSVVGIATGYGLEGPGIESRLGAKFSAPVQTGTGAHPVSYTMGTGSFPGAKSGRGVRLTPHPLLVPWSWKSRAISLLPYGTYGLYRASVPVQGWPLPLPCWPKSWYIRITWTNKMHYFVFIYFNNKHLHVSSRLAAHHQEDQLCINSSWYSYVEWQLPAASKHNAWL